MSYDRQLAQAAVGIAQRYHGSTMTQQAPVLPELLWGECQLHWGQMLRAQQCGWSLAAGVCQRRYLDARSHLGDYLRRGGGSSFQFTASNDELPPITAADIYSELSALAEEFTEVQIDRKQKRVTVCTEAISLEDVELGCFQIELAWDQLSREHASYRVVAMDPKPAESDSGVTHPHVSCDTLCEGEGQHAIRAAVAAGRLFDFFFLVRQVLRSYNADSAYVSLEDWLGSPCFDCGGSVHSDDRSDCNRCETVLCLDCSRNCCTCDRWFCYECCDSCWACESSCCYSCLHSCDDCEQSFCESCLTDGRCDACRENYEATEEENAEENHEESEEDSEEETFDSDAGTPIDAPGTSAVTLQPIRVGQAVVSA